MKKLIVGNWKMHKNLAEAVGFVQALGETLEAYKQVQPVICPPYLWLPVLDGLVRQSNLRLGAQNCAAWKDGAYTGEISATMLAGHCQYVIIGHSERRHFCHEDNDLINQKIGQALAAGLHPIVCISKQTEIEALSEIATTKPDWTIAYEPLEAIGSGHATDPKQVADMVKLIRHLLGPSTQVLYGGSVTPDNIAEYAAVSDGALVGGASLDPEQFIGLCAHAV